MNCKFLLVMFLGLGSVLVPFGGGVFPYRINAQQEVEFLLIFDPYQKNWFGKKNKMRWGFEYPGGSIGDKKIDGVIDPNNPYTFLYGAIIKTS